MAHTPSIGSHTVRPALNVSKGETEAERWIAVARTVNKGAFDKTIPDVLRSLEIGFRSLTRYRQIKTALARVQRLQREAKAR